MKYAMDSHIPIANTPRYALLATKRKFTMNMVTNGRENEEERATTTWEEEGCATTAVTRTVNEQRTPSNRIGVGYTEGILLSDECTPTCDFDKNSTNTEGSNSTAPTNSDSEQQFCRYSRQIRNMDTETIASIASFIRTIAILLDRIFFI